MTLEQVEYFDKGKRGLIFTGVLDGKKVLIKKHNPKADNNTITKEAAMLQRLNQVDIGPKFISFDGEQLVREFIDGERIEEFLEASSTTKDEAKEVLIQVLNQCRRMDELGINKFEMTHPYKHILISKKEKNLKVSMIDFERCLFTPRPKNVTQVCQYIIRLHDVLEKKGILLDQEKCRALAMEYKKKHYDKGVFEEICKLITQ